MLDELVGHATLGLVGTDDVIHHAVLTDQTIHGVLHQRFRAQHVIHRARRIHDVLQHRVETLVLQHVVDQTVLREDSVVHSLQITGTELVQRGVDVLD
ncbi:hypothetical protein, partial [Isoptericola cucumis]|uniref:hypothetical protein n=1 Tax=Isoptericola cucumis TaxID=1776856 RepID=UPI0039EF9A6A